MSASGYPGFDGLVDAFKNADQEALYAFSAVLQGWLSQEHKADGTHSAITADSLAATGAVSGGTTGAFAGNVTADSDGTPVMIGHGLGTSAGTETAVGDGIDINSLTGGVAIRAAMLLGVVGTGAFKSIAWLWRTATEALIPLLLRYEAATTSFRLMPGPVTNAAGFPCYLGSNTDSFGAGRWTNAYLKDCDSTAGYLERGYTIHMGEWAQVAFAAGNFTGSGTLTWTLQAGDQTVLAYRVTGKTLRVSWYLVATSTGGAASFALKIAIPGGFVAARRTMGFHHYSDNGAGVAQGIAFVDAAATTIDLYHGDFGATNWSNAAANTTGTQGAIEFEIQ